MASRADVARLTSTGRARSGGIRIAGSRRGSRSDRTYELYPFLVDPPPLPPIAPANERTAMGMPPFGRAVAIIANALASTSWYARRRDPETGIWARPAEQPSILTDPYPLSTQWHYKWGAAEDLILYGNHFALLGDLDWRTGRPGWLVPLPADEVWVITDPGFPGWYQWAIGGATFDADEIFHVPFGARSGELLGRGVLEQYGQWLGGANAAEQYSADTFAAGALPPAVLTSDRIQNQADADDLKDKWRALTSKREPVILPNGTTLLPVVGNAAQQQLVEGRTWNAQMVADAVGVPGWKLGLDGPTMTYQNIETADIDFVRDSVDRWGQPLTASITKWLLAGGNEAAWDYASRMRADQKSTQDVLSGYVTSGILTIDEARAALDRPPLPVTLPEEPGTHAEPSAADPAATAAAENETKDLAGAGVPVITQPIGGR
jgi:HK97 family phage portal protein